MAVTFLSTTLQAIYNGTNSGAVANASALTTFRTGGDITLDNDITALDERLASFETVLIGSLPVGKSSAAFPYDRAGLKREFLDEVTALLLKRSVSGNTVLGTYSGGGVLGVTTTGTISVGNAQIPDGRFRGGDQMGILKNGTTGFGDFDELNTANTTNDNDPRLSMLNSAGQAIFKSYANLIDQVFAEGDKLGNNPSQPVQLVSAIEPIVSDGRTYDRVSQVSGYNATAKVPTYQTFLLESTATTAEVIKDGDGNASLLGVDNSSARRIELVPTETSFNSQANRYTGTVDNIVFNITPVAPGRITLRIGNNGGQPATAEPFGPLVTNIPNKGHEFPDAAITYNYKYTSPGGVTYLIGASTEGKVYVTGLGANRTTTVGTTAHLNALEYLLFYNEARIKILRGQLAYREAVVREIQDDLKRANAALADLETQAGSITATDKDGQPTNQYAAENMNISLFNATNSQAGTPIFLRAGNDNIHNATEWTTIRVNLKNYIDRRSSEAQEASLDYQNTLNRFNNGLEVMAKLQEKLDGLLKGQLRNFN